MSVTGDSLCILTSLTGFQVWSEGNLHRESHVILRADCDDPLTQAHHG